MKTALEQAQARVVAWLDEAPRPGPPRRWLGPAHLDSYNSPDAPWRASFWVLEGSPPRGFVIETAGVVIAIGMLGDRKRVYKK